MYRRMNSSWMKHWDFELLDIALMELAFFMSYMIRQNISWTPWLSSEYSRLAVMVFAFDIVVVFFVGTYDNILQREAYREFGAVIRHVSYIYLLLLLYEYVMKETYLFSRTVFLLSWGLAIVFCYIGRLILKQIIRRRMMRERNQSNMLVISNSRQIEECLKRIYKKEFREFKICAVALSDTRLPERIPELDVPVMCGENVDREAIDYIRQHVVDEIFIDTFDNRRKLGHMVSLFLSMGITVHVSMGFLPGNLPNQLMESIGAANVLTTSIKTAPSWQLGIKRLVDIVGSIVGLVITGIAFLFIAPAIHHASPGPIIFKQQRVGKNGRVFYMYKFRSMYLDAEERKQALMGKNEMDGLMFKMKNDPRIIGSEKGEGKGIGNFIRRTSIDELPQFFNILKGDMSLVGTRPPTLGEYERYNLRHKIRLSLQPGLTGLWQVSGRSDITDFDEVVRLDKEYIENWSLLLDLKILFKTVGVVVKESGSC